jgi:outer membrane protein assembly factor BamB
MPQLRIAAMRLCLSFALSGLLASPQCWALPTRAAASQREDGVAVQLNPERTGSISFAAGFPPPLKVLWRIDAKGPTYPLVAGGRVYAVSNGNQAVAFDVGTGTKLWRQTLPGYGNIGAYDAGKIFFRDDCADLTGLDAATGAQLWSLQGFCDYTSSAPIARHGSVFISGGSLVAFDELTGALKWSRETQATEGSPAYGDGGIYVGGPCQYYKYGASDGATLWHIDNGCVGGGGISPAYFKSRVYLVNWAEGNFVLDSANGALLGSFAGGVVPSFFTGKDKRGFALEIADGKLFCVDAKTGNIAWSFANGDLYGQQPIVINSQPIVATNSGMLYMLDGANGTQLWSANLGAKVNNLNAGDGVLAVSAGTKLIVFGPQ